MACHRPLPAWRSHLSGGVTLREPVDVESGRYEYLRLPCGNCLGCRQSRAREWAFRCQLERSEHDDACFVTLTYADEFVPPTLDKRHLSSYLKRLRRRVHPRGVRFFGCGEYGEQNGRPHYHLILFGLALNEPAIRDCWSFGFVRTDPCTPETIKYVAGYTQKKAGRPERNKCVEWVDDFGEVHTLAYQAPFILMSRRPGIAGAARRFTESWRIKAIQDGKPIPVPRFLHAAWVKGTTPEQHEKLKAERAALPRPLMDKAALEAARLDAETRQSLKRSTRKL